MRRAFLQVFLGVLLLAGVARPCRAAGESDGGFRPPSHRFGITPAWTHAFVVHSVSHEALGLSAEIFLGRRYGIAMLGSLYAPFSSSPNRVPSAFPLNETYGSWFTEFRFTLLRGDRAELAVVGGPGVIVTRPVSVIHPEHRRFEFDNRLALSAGAVARVFILRQLALSMEARYVAYREQLENERTEDLFGRQDPESVWYGEIPLTHMVEARLGLTVFFSER